MLLDIISCNDYELAKILEVARNLLKVATILVPVLLVVLLIMDIMKTITTADVDQKKLFKSISNRVIAAIAVFLVPYVIDFIVDIIPMGASNWRDCWGVDATEVRVQNDIDETLEKIKGISSQLQEFTIPNNKAYELYNQAIDLLKDIPESSEKQELTHRLDVLKKSMDAEKAVDELRQYLKTSSATKTGAEKLYNTAKQAVDKLPESGKKMNLNASLDNFKVKINRLT